MNRTGVMLAFFGLVATACGGGGNLTFPHLDFAPTAAPGMHPVVCVQGVDIKPERELVAAQKIADAMLEVKQDGRWEDKRWDRGVSLGLAMGCSAPHALDGAGNISGPLSTPVPGPTGPASWDLAVYIYPDDVLRDQSYRTFQERNYCDVDVCEGYGNSVYLTPGDICDEAFLVKVLRQMFRLLGESEEPPIFVHSTATPTPGKPAFIDGRVYTPEPTRSWTPTPTPRVGCF